MTVDEQNKYAVDLWKQIVLLNQAFGAKPLNIMLRLSKNHVFLQSCELVEETNDDTENGEENLPCKFKIPERNKMYEPEYIR